MVIKYILNDSLLYQNCVVELNRLPGIDYSPYNTYLHIVNFSIIRTLDPWSRNFEPRIRELFCLKFDNFCALRYIFYLACRR